MLGKWSRRDRVRQYFLCLPLMNVVIGLSAAVILQMLAAFIPGILNNCPDSLFKEKVLRR